MTAKETRGQDIKGKTLRGGLAKLFGQVANSALRLGFIALLARLLDPQDFGIVTMVTVITAFLDQFSTAGLSAAAVQKLTITNEQISTLFWFNILVGLILALLCLTIAPVLVSFYHEPRLFWVTAAMGTTFLFSSAGVQHNVLLQRELRYISLTVIAVVSQLTSIGIGVCLAFAGYGYWALVAAAIALPATMTACMWFVTAWIPRRPRWDAEAHSMLRFGGTVTLNGVVVYVAYNLDKVLLGRVWGADALGLYGTAGQLINVPTAHLNTAIGGVAFAALSRLQDDVTRYRNYFLKGYTLIISMTLPVTIFAAAFAEDLVLVVLGPKWTDAIPIFRLLTPTILVFGMIDPLAWLLLSSGRQVRSLQMGLVVAVLVITSYCIGLPFGPKGMAFAFSAAMMIWLVPCIFWCVRGTTLSALDLFWVLGRPLLSASVAAALALGVQFYFGAPHSPFMRLLLEGGIMVVGYSVTLLFVLGQKDFYFELLRAVVSSSKTTESEAVIDSSLTQR